MRKGGGKQKGNAFERKVCKMFSLWWTKGKRTDVFYRSDSSGARATARRKQGKTTLGQYGDMAARDRRGSVLTNTIAFEFKDWKTAGQSVFDFVDSTKQRIDTHPYFRFFKQAMTQMGPDHVYWMLIAKRPYKHIVAYIPADLFFNLFCDIVPPDGGLAEMVVYLSCDKTYHMSTQIICSPEIEKKDGCVTIVAVQLEKMLEILDPRAVEQKFKR